jgi:hypothetical protein
MARRRKTASEAMNELEQNVAGMKSIEPDLDAGSGVTVATGEALLADARAALEDYNATLAMSDEKLNVFIAKDKLTRAFNKKIKPAVGLKYGTDSDEYEKVGGVRESERKKPVRKPKA